MFKSRVSLTNTLYLQEIYVDDKSIDFYICLNEKRIGKIDLRFTMDDEMYYFGQVGYSIDQRYQGHNYAYYACQILFQLARDKYKMHSLIITCSPNNIASLKTLQKLNGTLLEKVNVPIHHELFRRNETEKYIFAFKL